MGQHTITVDLAEADAMALVALLISRRVRSGDEAPFQRIEEALRHALLLCDCGVEVSE
jgi:hypothetical protein